MSPATLTDTGSFIEAQFPVSKVSKESYNERKSGNGQTLPSIGKWWGRKPLVMVRAALIGLLMPPSDDPKRDREIFLNIMTMDDAGLWRRKAKNIRYSDVFDLLTEEERGRYFDLEQVESGKAIHHCIDSNSREEKREIKETIQRLAFGRLPYDEKLRYCDRPEEIEGPSERAWTEINAHLGTHAKSLKELVQELGERQFGHTPRLGDAFCGGGNIPFEAARLGFKTYGSDLNPVAALLTWASLNIVGGGEEVADRVRKAQEKLFAAVDRQIAEWGIEHNDKGWRADAYLYCMEAQCPECGVRVPLAPSWVIGKGTNTIAQLELDEAAERFNIHIDEGASKAEIEAADAGTVQGDSLHCPACERATPMKMIRGDRRGTNGTAYGLRMWENNDIVPRPDDTFQERLYCVRWVETHSDGTETRHYRSVTDGDLQREAKVLRLLEQRFDDWQAKGYIPSRRIEPGDKTDEPIRTRGWTHWHHLFNPRQLIQIGLLSEKQEEMLKEDVERVGCLLGIGKLADWNSKLCRWVSAAKMENGVQTFSNQALNTLYDYYTRPINQIETVFYYTINSTDIGETEGEVKPDDSRSVKYLSAFFLNGTRIANARWPSRATRRASAATWWRATATWPSTCRTTACRSSCSPIKTPVCGPTSRSSYGPPASV